MLKQMRSNIKSLSWTLWLVIFAFVGFIFVEWGSGRLDSFGGEKDLLSINGEIVTGEAYHRNLLQALEGMKQQFKDNLNPTLITQLRIPEQVLQSLINTTILQEESEDLHLDVSDEELREKIITHPRFQRDGRFIGREAYERLLAYSRIDIREFEDNLRQSILIEKFMALLTGGIVIDNETLWRRYQKSNDTAELEVFTMTTDRVDADIPAPEKNLRKFYTDNEELFMTDPQRSGLVVAVNYDDFKEGVSFSDQELRDYFRANKNDFTVPGKTRVSRIYLPYDPDSRERVFEQAQEIQSRLTPQNFAETAAEFSLDKQKDNGGDWGYWEWKNLTKQEQSIIRGLKQGEISTIVDTQEGFALLMVSELVEETQENFNDVKERIRDILTQERLRELAEKKLLPLSERAGSGENLQAAATEAGLTVIETGPISAGDSLPEIEDMGYISRELFSLESTGDVAFPIEYSTGMAVAQLQEIIQPTLAPFAEVSEQVKERYLHEQKMARLMEEAQAIHNQLNMLDVDGQNRWLSGRNLEGKDVTYRRGSRLEQRPVQEGLDEIIFSMQPGEVSAPINFGDEVVMMRAKTIKTVTREDFQQDRRTFYQQQVTEERSNFFRTHVMNLRDDYKIRFNQELFNRINESVMSRI